MPVTRRTYEAMRADLARAETDRDHWQRQAEAATANAATVLSAVDSALCALALVHDMDPETGVCACGHPSPCPSGVAVAGLWRYWEQPPAKVLGIIGREAA